MIRSAGALFYPEDSGKVWIPLKPSNLVFVAYSSTQLKERTALFQSTLDTYQTSEQIHSCKKESPSRAEMCSPETTLMKNNN